MNKVSNSAYEMKSLSQFPKSVKTALVMLLCSSAGTVGLCLTTGVGMVSGMLGFRDVCSYDAALGNHTEAVVLGSGNWADPPGLDCTASFVQGQCCEEYISVFL